MPTSILAPLCLFALLVSPARGDVWTVDQNGAEDFVRVQDAVNAAQDGDTILVRRQHDEVWLDGFVVDGKALSVVAFDPERLSITSIVVRNLAPGQTFVLSGFNVLVEADLGHLPGTDPDAVAILLEDNGGSVRIQDCAITGTEGWNHDFDGPGTDALCVRASQDVTLALCEVLGGLGYEDGNDAGFGLRATDSRVSFYDSTLAGGVGGYDIGFMMDSTGGDGGDGARVFGGELYVANGSVAGGLGGSGGGWSASFGGDGGNGMTVLSGATVHALATEIEFGPGGYGLHGFGEDGVRVRGPITELTAELPTVSTPRGYASESGTVNVRVVGTPGDAAQLLVSQTTVATLLAPDQGFLHLGAPDRIDLGVIPAGGQLVHPFALPDVASGGTRLYLQASTQLGTAPPRLSNPHALVVLDDAHVPDCGGRVYVDLGAAPGGDGQSWATAFADLRLALDAQPYCPGNPTEVWIAEGVYPPALPAGNPHLSFRLHSGVHVYGGFAGNETTLAERDPGLHPVVLTGDLNGDDLPGFQNRGDNSRHVVRTGSLLYRSKNVRLDGVTVRGGESTDMQAEDGGAGIQGRCNDLVVARCTVEDNRAAGFGRGAGLLQWRSGTTTIVESAFQGNAAGGYAGGISIRSDDTFAEVHIANCVVRGNTSGQYGGGINIRTFVGTLTNTTVWANSAERTGGVLVAMISSFQVSNCIIWGNTDTTSASRFRENFDCPYPAWSNLRYSNVEGWNGFGGSTNMGLDPQFRNPFFPYRLVGGTYDLRLSATSPCIDAAWNNAVPADTADLDNDGDTSEPTPTDLDHAPRFVDHPLVVDTGSGSPPVVDMGAYEHSGP